MTTPWALPPHDPPADAVVRRLGILKRPGQRGKPSGRNVTWPEDHDAYDIIDGSPAPPLSESGHREWCEWLEGCERFDQIPWPQVSQPLEQSEARPSQPKTSETKPQALGKAPQTRTRYLQLQLDVICDLLKHWHISQHGREYFITSRMVQNN